MVVVVERNTSDKAPGVLCRIRLVFIGLFLCNQVCNLVVCINRTAFDTWNFGTCRESLCDTVIVLVEFGLVSSDAFNDSFSKTSAELAPTLLSFT